MTMPDPSDPAPADETTMTDEERSTLSEAECTAYDGAIIMLQERRNVMVDPAFIRDTIGSLAAARDALERLMSWQNGPPLPSRRWVDGWEDAMARAEAASKPGDSHAPR
jgi:hypothetical protein